jgi:hypothetical protein
MTGGRNMATFKVNRLSLSELDEVTFPSKSEEVRLKGAPL